MVKYLELCTSAEALTAAKNAASYPWVGYNNSNKTVAYKGKN